MTGLIPEVDARRKLVANEQAKPTATYINGLSIAVFAVGGLSPFITAPGIVTEQYGFLAGAFILLGVFSLSSSTLDLVARSPLGSLDP